MPSPHRSITALPTVMLILTAMALAGPAGAHHPMGGAVPATIWQGLLSGIGHPLIEFEHLLFLLAAGLAAALAPLSNRSAVIMLLIYAGAGAVGTAWHVTGAVVPMVDMALAVSLLVVAMWLWTRSRPGAILGALGTAAAGFFHGYAYGEAVLGAETSPVVAYLCGLAVIQSLLMMAVFFALRRMAFVASPKLTATTRALAVFVGASGLWLSWAGNLGT